MAKTTYAMVKAWRKKNPEKWREQRRSYNKRNADTVIARRRRYKDKNRVKIREDRDNYKEYIAEFLAEHKHSVGCLLCPENFPPALDFHHMGDKLETLSMARNRGRSIRRIVDEMAKCVVLCANCHRKVHSGVLSVD